MVEVVRSCTKGVVRVLSCSTAGDAIFGWHSYPKGDSEI